MRGDRSRKLNLVNHGFRLPSALDNRPLIFAEFEQLLEQAVFVSATPGKEEIRRSSQVVEQIIRPTGLLDPPIEVRATEGQIEDLFGEIKENNRLGLPYPDYHPDKEDVRGSYRLSQRNRHPGKIPAFRDRNH